MILILARLDFPLDVKVLNAKPPIGFAILNSSGVYVPLGIFFFFALTDIIINTLNKLHNTILKSISNT